MLLKTDVGGTAAAQATTALSSSPKLEAKRNQQTQDERVSR